MQIWNNQNYIIIIKIISNAELLKQQSYNNDDKSKANVTSELSLVLGIMYNVPIGIKVLINNSLSIAESVYKDQHLRTVKIVLFDRITEQQSIVSVSNKLIVWRNYITPLIWGTFNK